MQSRPINGNAPVLSRGRKGAVLFVLLFFPSAVAATNGYLGSDVCAGCHPAIAASQSRTNMAKAWQGADNSLLPTGYSETFTEGPAPAITYELSRTAHRLQYRVKLPERQPVDLPVEATIGGERHGISFLVRLDALEGSPLPRATLIEARYFHYQEQNKLALELGFPVEKPSSYETAFGRVLTPDLQTRCFACHGAPRTFGTRTERGITCESCHGPGQPHLAALAAHQQDPGILNPKKLPVAERWRPCRQCHAGTSVVEDPLPDDTLISNQVTSLENTECWRQSGGDFTCTDCHDPHRDAPSAELIARSEKVCLRCHSAAAARHAALCPVNRTAKCIGCHLPEQTRGAFVMADHWIRVPRERQAQATARDPAWRTTITPTHLYLRVLVTDDRQKATAIRRQILQGGSFFELARANSLDRESAPNGGFLGDLDRSQLDPAWSAAALKLRPGEISDLIDAGGKYFTLERAPRDFREDAEAVFKHAMELRKQGRQQEAINELLAALKIYPRFLRALTWLGAIYGQSGSPAVTTGILTIATRLYPRDSGAHFNLALAYGAAGKPEEIDEYRRAIEIDPDLFGAYLNWGASLYEKGRYDEAIRIYRRGLEVNPLLASLHYSLAAALEHQHRTKEAEQEMELARKIDPKIAPR